MKRPFEVTVLGWVLILTAVSDLGEGIARFGVPGLIRWSNGGAGFFALGVLGLVAGIAVLLLRSWAWVLGMVAAVLGLALSAAGMVLRGMTPIPWEFLSLAVLSLIALFLLFRSKVRTSLRPTDAT